MIYLTAHPENFPSSAQDINPMYYVHWPKFDRLATHYRPTKHTDLFADPTKFHKSVKSWKITLKVLLDFFHILGEMKVHHHICNDYMAE